MADIDFGQLSEALNDKSDRDLRNVDTTAKADAVIDFQLPAADNGYTWYRKYASGWVEQGGVLKINNNWETVTIPVEMSNNNYCIYLQVTDSTENATTCGLKVSANTVTTTTFRCSSSYKDTTYLKPKMYWQVSGMAA